MRRPTTTILLLAAALAGFAGNSLLCRAALRGGGIDPVAFTVLRLASGAAMLGLLLALRARRSAPAPAPRGGGLAGDWPSAMLLFGYALLFALAYRALTAATGALLLFGAVQLAMLAQAWRRGEALGGRRGLGIALACAGLAVLLLPGWQAPDPWHALAMLGAGMAWAGYSLRGRAARDALADTTGNFLRALPIAVPLALALVLSGQAQARADARGLACALASGALASGLAYALWYAVLPRLSRSAAATAQLAVPVLAAAGGSLWLGEALSWRLLVAGAAVLGGLSLVLAAPRALPAATRS